MPLGFPGVQFSERCFCFCLKGASCGAGVSQNPSQEAKPVATLSPIIMFQCKMGVSPILVSFIMGLFYLHTYIKYIAIQLRICASSYCSILTDSKKYGPMMFVLFN